MTNAYDDAGDKTNHSINNIDDVNSISTTSSIHLLNLCQGIASWDYGHFRFRYIHYIQHSTF